MYYNTITNLQLLYHIKVLEMSLGSDFEAPDPENMQ